MTTYTRSIAGGPLLVDTADHDTSVAGFQFLVVQSAAATSVVRYYLGSDVDAGGWSNNQGGSILYTAVNEQVADDGAFIQSSLTPSADPYIGAFANCQTPASYSGVVLYYRIKAAGGANLTVKLMSGTDEIASVDHNPGPTSWTTYTLEIASGPAATINYPAARLKVIADTPA